MNEDAIRRVKDRLSGLRLGFGVTGLKIAQAFLGFLVSVVLARYLGPENFGLYSFALAIATIISVPILVGVSNLLVRELTAFIETQQWAFARGIIRWGEYVAVLYAAIWTLVGLSFAFAIGLNGKEMLVAAVWGLLLVPLLSLLGVWTGALRAVFRPAMSTLPEAVFWPGGLLLMLVASIAMGFSYSWLTAIQLSACVAALSALAAWLMMRSSLPAEFSEMKLREFRYSEWLKGALPFSLAAGLLILNRQIDLIVLGALSDERVVGIYRIAAQSSVLLTFGVQAAGSIYAAKFASISSSSLVDTATALKGSIYISLLVAAPGFLFLALFGSPFVRFIFGDAYIEAYLPLVVLSLGNVFVALNGAAAQLLGMRGYQTDLVWVYGGVAIANVVLNLVLVPPFGIFGAACATTISIVTWSLVVRKTLLIRIGVDPLRLLFGRREQL